MRDDAQTKRLRNQKHMLSEQKTPHNDYISFFESGNGEIILNNFTSILHKSTVKIKMPLSLFHLCQRLPRSALKCSLWSVAGGSAQTAVPASAQNDSLGPRTLAGCAWRAGSERSRHTTLLQPAGELSAVPYGVRKN